MKIGFLNVLLPIILIGICIGVLTGLSVSPVIQTVVSCILTFVVSLFTLWVSIEPAKKNEVLPFIGKVHVAPVLCLVLGLTAGAFLGIYVRTHDLLSPKSANGQVMEAKMVDSHSTVLFAEQVDLCNAVKAYSGSALIGSLRGFGEPKINALIDSVGEDKPEEIKKILTVMVCE
ncbi:MAG: hypothetical protein V4663_05100 [Bacteroidota bacterium]